MSDEKSRLALRAAVEDGAKRCAASLAKITKDEWRCEGLSVGPATQAELDGLLGDFSEMQYGVRFTAPGASLLVLIPRKAGMRLTDRFTRAYADPIDGLEKREQTVLAEVANIVVNPLIGALADATGRDLLISAPQSYTDAARDLLVRALSSLPDSASASTFSFARLACAGQPYAISVLVIVDEDTVGRLKL